MLYFVLSFGSEDWFDTNSKQYFVLCFFECRLQYYRAAAISTVMYTTISQFISCRRPRLFTKWCKANKRGTLIVANAPLEDAPSNNPFFFEHPFFYVFVF